VPELERISVTIERDLLERFDRVAARSGHDNRSEAVRDLIRARLLENDWAAGDGEAVATVTLVYDHNQRTLSDKLVRVGHEHHHSVRAGLTARF